MRKMWSEFFEIADGEREILLLWVFEKMICHKCGHMKGDHNVEGCMEWIGSSNVGTRGVCDCKTFRLSHECSLGSLW